MEGFFGFNFHLLWRFYFGVILSFKKLGFGISLNLSEDGWVWIFSGTSY